MSKSQAAVKPLKDLYELDELPPLGHVPEKMYAWAIRRERHGAPQDSFQVEVVPTWSIGEEEVLLLVMAGGVNYNGIWAGLGQPISPFDVHKAPFYDHRGNLVGGFRCGRVPFNEVVVDPGGY